MMNSFYRKYRCIEDIFNEDRNLIQSLDRVINLGDVSTYRSVEDTVFGDNIKRCYIEFNLPVRPIVIRVNFNNFDNDFTEYHRSCGTLDERSQKKRLIYNGPLKMYFSIDQNVMSSVGYPYDFDFRDKHPDTIIDSMLCNFITPFN